MKNQLVFPVVILILASVLIAGLLVQTQQNSDKGTVKKLVIDAVGLNRGKGRGGFSGRVMSLR